MKVGVTGHQTRAGIDWQWTSQEIRNALIELGCSLEGYSSLAIGADQLFAKIVLEVGGSLVVIIPARNYRSCFEGRGLRSFLSLRSKAKRIVVLPGEEIDQAAFLQAGRHIVDVTDLLIAVWDGKPAAGLGGTADIVRYAQKRRKSVLQFDPIAKVHRTLN